MSSIILQFLISALAIIAAGAALTQFGEIISKRTNLGGMLVGVVLLAGATSLPELAVDISAVRMGAADLAVGDLFGSCLFNLLILAVLDLTRYSRGRIFSEASARHALSACVSIALVATAAIFITLGPKLGSASFLGAGPGAYALLVAYVLGIRLMFHAQKMGTPEPGNDSELWFEWLKKLGLKGAIIGYLAAAAVILLAAPRLAAAADHLAEESGLGGTFFGTTFVALCTSLPEIVTTFAAVRMKSFGLAVGNVFGSNCFNMVILIPLDYFHPGSLLSSVSQSHTYTALSVVVVTSIVILGQLYRVERKKPILEPDAWLAVLVIVAALTGLYFVST